MGNGVKIIGNGEWLVIRSGVYKISQITSIGVNAKKPEIGIYVNNHEFAHRFQTSKECDQTFMSVLEILNDSNRVDKTAE